MNLQAKPAPCERQDSLRLAAVSNPPKKGDRHNLLRVLRKLSQSPAVLKPLLVESPTGRGYRHWQHEQYFEATEDGTLCLDIVVYSVYGGSLINALFVRRDSFTIFASRESMLREHFPDSGASPLRFNRI